MEEATRETETQDFMNVESFSQLPFISRTPSKDKNPKPIRLFGKYFTGGDCSGTTNQEDYSDSSETKNKQEEEEESQTGDNSKDKSITNKKRFECHYCFRNFPTSQALGGHQNAHKRERQLAKRGASSYFHHPDTNLYNYRHYPSWTGGSLPAARSYEGYASGPLPPAYYTRPISRSSLGQWRVPPSSSGVQGVYNSNAAFTSHGSFNSTSPLLAGSQPQPPLQEGGSTSQNRMSSYRYSLSPNVQGHVSLDLHL